MFLRDSGIIKDEKAVSVIFGTLLIILLTITAASGLAFMISESQKNYMERQAQISAVENEDLRIMGVDMGDGCINVSVLNADTQSTKIMTVLVNDRFVQNYVLLNAAGDIEKVSGDYPKIYNYNIQPSITGGNNLILHIPAENLVLKTEENITITSRSVSLSHDPGQVYTTPNVTCIIKDQYNNTYTEDYFSYNPETHKLSILNSDCCLLPDVSCTFNYNNETDNNFTFSDYYGINNTDQVSVFYNSTEILQAGNWSFISGEISGENSYLNFEPSLPTGQYTINYTKNDNDFQIYYTTRFPTIPESSLQEGQSLEIELMSKHIKIFKRLFSPPIPIIDVSYLRSGYNTTMLLDASHSTDDGFIGKYEWAISDGNTTEIQRGILAQHELNTSKTYSINLTVTDDTGMKKTSDQINLN